MNKNIGYFVSCRVPQESITTIEKNKI